MVGVVGSTARGAVVERAVVVVRTMVVCEASVGPAARLVAYQPASIRNVPCCSSAASVFIGYFTMLVAAAFWPAVVYVLVTYL